MNYKGSTKLYEIYYHITPFWSIFGLHLNQLIEGIEELRPIKNGYLVLDVACGTGFWTRAMAKKNENGQLIGLDLSWPMLKQALKYIRREKIKNITYLRGEAHNLPFPDNTFNVVNCFGALHLFADPDKFFQEVWRVLKPGGHFGCQTLLTEGENFIQNLNLKILRDLGSLRLFKDEELNNQLEKAGFSEYKSKTYAGVILFGVKK